MLTLFRPGRLSFGRNTQRSSSLLKRSESRCAHLLSYSPYPPSLSNDRVLRAILVGPVLFVLHNPLPWWNCSSHRIAFARCSVSAPNALSDLRSDWMDTRMRTVWIAISIYLSWQNVKFHLLADHGRFRLLMHEVLRIWNFFSCWQFVTNFSLSILEYLR